MNAIFIRRSLVIALGASCTGRPFVEVDDGSTTGADEAGNMPVSEGIVSVGDEAGDSVDDANDDEAGEVAGDVPTCGEPQAAAVAVDIWPGEDPIEGGAVLHDLGCTIAGHDVAEDGHRFAVECTTDEGEDVILDLRVDADSITVPEGLDWPTPVHVRASTFRDTQLVGEFPWLRSDHFAMYREGELVLAAGAGGWWPSNAQGETDPDFWAPFRLETGATDCSVKPVECHEAQETALRITLGEEAIVGAAYSMVTIGGYDVQIGEMVDSDSTQCEEPSYGWFSFAIAPTP